MSMRWQSPIRTLAAAALLGLMLFSMPVMAGVCPLCPQQSAPTPHQAVSGAPAAMHCASHTGAQGAALSGSNCKKHHPSCALSASTKGPAVYLERASAGAAHIFVLPLKHSSGAPLFSASSQNSPPLPAFTILVLRI